MDEEQNENTGAIAEDEVATKGEGIKQMVLKDLAKINGKINKMSYKEIRGKLKHYKLDTSGADGVIRQRLKHHYRQIKLKSADLYLSSSLYPYYVIIDFEATCEAFNPPEYVHEIIEFPAVLVETSSQSVVSTFQKYCKPTQKSELSEFCTELTGITQDMVDTADNFPEVLISFKAWLKENKLLQSKNLFMVVADGPWDMTKFLHTQCKLSHCEYPTWAHTWINLRKAFSNFYRCQRCSLIAMLDRLGMSFEGRQHCGLDDAKNIARVLIRMMCDGATLQPNEKIVLEKEQTDGNEKAEDILVDKLSQMKLIAQARTIQNQVKPLTYNKVKQERGAAEQKIARQMIKAVNLEGETLEEVRSEENTEPTKKKHLKR